MPCGSVIARPRPQAPDGAFEGGFVRLLADYASAVDQGDVLQRVAAVDERPVDPGAGK